MEIPVAFPSVLPTDHIHDRTYVINDVTGTIRSKHFGIIGAQQQHQQKFLGGVDTTSKKRVGFAPTSTITHNDTQQNTTQTTSTTSSSSSSQHQSNDRGSASVSYLTFPTGIPNNDGKISTSKSFVVTTTPVIHGDGFSLIAVSLFPMTNSDERDQTKTYTNPISVVHIDVGSQTQHYRTTVKVQAFAVTTKNRNPMIQLTFLDTQGYLLSMYLSSIDLTPIQEPLVACYSIGSILEMKIQRAIATYSIRSSMVLFISNNMILLSLNPFLFTIHIGYKIAIPWSKSICLEEMKDRTKNRGIVRSLFGLLTGSSGATNQSGGGGMTTTQTGYTAAAAAAQKHVVFDMIPVSAIAAADNDPSHIFTLHSDGTIRRWVVLMLPSSSSNSGSGFMEDGTEDHNMDDTDNDEMEMNYDIIQYMKPYEVYDLKITPSSNSNFIPSPDLWSDHIHSMCMTARLYDSNQLFALALYIQTSSGSSNRTDTSTAMITTTQAGYYDSLTQQAKLSNSYSQDDGDDTQYENFAYNEVEPNPYHGRVSSNDFCHIVVLDGSVGDINYYDSYGNSPDDVDFGVKKVHCIKLQVPINAVSLTSMQFDSQQDRCTIKALFQTTRKLQQVSTIRLNKTLPISSASILVTYPPSNLSIVYREPTILDCTDMLDTISIEEYNRIVNLSFPQCLKSKTNDTITDTSVKSEATAIDECLHELDCQYLQYLFRPTFTRGTGTILPPSQYSIQTVIQSPKYNNSGTTRYSQASSMRVKSTIELQVLRAIHECRKNDSNLTQVQKKLNKVTTTSKQADNTKSNSTNSRNGSIRFASMTPVRQQRNLPLRKSTPMPKLTYTASVYDEITDEEEEEEIENRVTVYEEENNKMIVDEISEDNNTSLAQEQVEYQSSSSPDIDHANVTIQCNHHEQRWRQLLLDVWEVEDRERTTLTFYIPPKLAANCSDSVIIVRSACVSVMTCSAKDDDTDTKYLGGEGGSTPNLSGSLDFLAQRVLQLVDSNHHDSSLLKAAEHYCWEMQSSGEMSYKPSLVASIEKKLKKTMQDFIESLEDEKHSKGFIKKLRRTSEQEILEHMIYIPAYHILPLFGPSSHDCKQINTAGIIAGLLDNQTRLAGSSLFFRHVQYLRRLFLGRFFVLSKFHTSTSVQTMALKMYLHAGNIQWAAAQIVPLPAILSPVNPFLEKTNSPPKKRTSFGSGISSILPIPGGKTTVLDSMIIQNVSAVVMNTSIQSMALLSISLSRVALSTCFQFVTPIIDGSFSYESLPELGILAIKSGIPNEHARLVSRLLAPFVSLRHSNEIPKVVATRDQLMAEALLGASKHEASTELSKYLISRAFDLLPFDANDLPNSRHKIETLNKHALENDKLAPSFLHYVSASMEAMKLKVGASVFGESPSMHATSEVYSMLSMLWTIHFSTAVSVRSWDTAYVSCLECPNQTERINNARRLILSLVDAGALDELIDKCSQNSDNFDMYELAVEELSEMSKRDCYTQLASQGTHPSDYNLALYSLFAAKQHWKYAAQALDKRYQNGMKCLRQGNLGTELPNDLLLKRDKIIIDDLSFAANGSHRALLMVADTDERFFVTGETHQLSTFPSNFTGRIQSKRGRGTSVHFPPTEHDAMSEKSRFERFMTSTDVEARAIRASVLKVLFDDDMCDNDFVKEAFFSTVDMCIADTEIISKLFSLGHYSEGLMLASTTDKLFGSTSSHFYNELCHLVSDFLIPISISLNDSQIRPTIIQLEDTLDYVSGKSQLLIVDRYKKLCNLKTSDRQRYTMSLLQNLVERYVSARIPIDKVVVESFLIYEAFPSSVPSWLENIMLYGRTEGLNHGSFAIRRIGDSQEYLGDPHMLVNLYIRYGLYIDACRIVCTVLYGNKRTEKSSSQLPEKGNIDFIPYVTIDRLWNLIEQENQNGSLSKEQTKTILSSRNQMEQSLEYHFDMLKISEKGMMSARTLS